MKNTESWKPTKFIYMANRWQSDRSGKYVSPGSRYIAGIQIREYVRILERYARGDLLDIGCGNVPLYGVYKDLVGSVTCVDWSNTLHKNVYLDYEMDLNERLSLEDGSFDTVVLTDVLEHIADPALLLSEVERILRRGGRALITVPFFTWLHEVPHDYHRYTEFALRHYANKAGLQVKELSPYGGSPEVLMDFIAKHLRFSKLFSATHNLVANLLTNNAISRKISLKTSKLFPLGYVLVLEK